MGHKYKYRLEFEWKFPPTPAEFKQNWLRPVSRTAHRGVIVVTVIKKLARFVKKAKNCYIVKKITNKKFELGVCYQYKNGVFFV
jgi:hypothetical protein